jgi:hypothetical protein
MNNLYLHVISSAYIMTICFYWIIFYIFNKYENDLSYGNILDCFYFSFCLIAMKFKSMHQKIETTNKKCFII